MAIKKDTLDQLLDGRDPKEVFDKDGLFDELKKALAERVLNAELDNHLESEAPAGRRNHRNGHSKKTVLTETAKLDIRIPRDREGTFDPKLIAQYQRRFPGFDEKIVSMYARGMTRAGDPGPLHGALWARGLARPDLDGDGRVLETVAEWQNRPLEASYPLVFFDAMRVKIRDEGMVRNKAVYIALGVQRRRHEGYSRPVDRADRRRQVLAAGHERTQEPRRRRHSHRRCRWPEGLPRSDHAVFPEAIVQTCIVHLIRHSLEFVSWKDRKPVVPALQQIYRAKDADAGKAALDAFDAGPWGRKYPAIAQSWRRNWAEVIPVLRLPRRRSAGSSTPRMRSTSRFCSA